MTSSVWAVGIARLDHGPHGDADGDDADRHVDPEHGRPRVVLDQEAAEQRADRQAQAGDAGPDADRGGQLLAREGGDQDRERQRVQERAADALHDPERDQLGVGRGERARGRCEREDDQPDQEHALAAEAVTELAAEQDQRGEREDVGVDRPLEVLRGRCAAHAGSTAARRSRSCCRA